MSGETTRLVDLVTKINPDCSCEQYDMAVSSGDQVSVSLLAETLEYEGLKAKSFIAYQLEIYTNALHGRDRIKSIDCQNIRDAWQEEKLPIISGFQGVSPRGKITTLGLGGSDTSAVALAVALDAHFCEINTDVDGFFTADPRVVPGDRLNREMDFDVTLEMASLGIKVLHARCLELEAKYDMPLVIRNTFKEEKSERTRIIIFSEKKRLESPVVSGVTLARQVSRVTIDGLSDRTRLFAEIFQQITQVGVNVNIIMHNQMENKDEIWVGFSVDEGDLVKLWSNWIALRWNRIKIS